uniref:Variant surface glycoprotein 431 n=1 Tax=Trypanosoma brucei TaxID=5691 RepID=M4TD85_9TRYP|nr:variant surface glycoprotein 431 [Trypanosoma brucei]
MLILIALAATAARAVQNDPAATGIKTLCDEWLYIEQLTATLQQKSSNAVTALENDALTTAKYTLASRAANSPAEQCLMLALASKAAVIQKENAISLQTVVSKLKEPLALLEKQKGIIEAAIEASKIKVNADTGSRHGKSGAGNTAISLSASNGAPGDCTLQTPAGTIQINSQEPKPQQLIALRLTKAADISKLLTIKAIDIAVTSSGCQSGHNYDQNLGAALDSCSFSGGATGAAVNGHSQYQTVTQATNIFDSTEYLGECHNSVKSAVKTNDANLYLARQICEGLKLSAKLETMPELSGSALAGDNIIQKAVAACTPGFGKTKKAMDNKQAENLQNYIKEAYGETAEKFATKFKTVLKTKRLMTSGADANERKAIDDLTAADDVPEMLSQLLAEQLAKQQQQQQVQIGSTEDKKENNSKMQCTGETDKDKCNEKNGCKYNEKDSKCEDNTPKATTAGESTSKRSEKKSESDCKSPDCKWENNACKDSSFFVKKHYALTVVSAAFVSLLEF